MSTAQTVGLAIFCIFGYSVMGGLIAGAYQNMFPLPGNSDEYETRNIIVFILWPIFIIPLIGCYIYKKVTEL